MKLDTSEKHSIFDSHEKNTRQETSTLSKKVHSEENKKSLYFALGSLDDKSIDINKYKCVTVSRNQLDNIRQCNHCNMIFDQLDDLQDHTIEHFEAKILSILPSKKAGPCPSCQKKFPSYNALKNHYGLHHYCSKEDLNGLLLWAELGKAMLYFPI